MQVGRRITREEPCGSPCDVYWYKWGAAGWAQVKRLADSTDAFARTFMPVWETERNTRAFVRSVLLGAEQSDASW